MQDVIIVVVLFVIIFSAVCYIKKSKKKNIGCIGCPNAAKCSEHCHKKN